MNNRWTASLAGLFLLAACGGSGAATTNAGGSASTVPGSSVQTFEDQGRDHLDPVEVQAILNGGQGPAYDSSPATSGPHAPQAAPCGIYLEDVPDIFLVHSMEHGAIVIHYDPALVPDPTELQQFARDRGSYVIVHPRSGLGHAVVLTAWTKMLVLDSVDIAAISRFYDEFATRGPEAGVPCPFEIDATSG